MQHRLSVNDTVSGVLITKAILSIGQSHTSDHAIGRLNLRPSASDTRSKEIGIDEGYEADDDRPPPRSISKL